MQRRVSSLQVLLCAGSALTAGCGASSGGSSRGVPPSAAPEAPADLQEGGAPAFPIRPYASFEAGAYGDEQLWLLPLEGAPVPALTFDDGATVDDGVTVAHADSSLGYRESGGRITATLFDAAQRRLIASVREPSGSSVRWLDLSTGAWTTLDLTGSIVLRDTEYGPVILATNGDELTVTAAVGYPFQTVARLTLPAQTWAEDLKVLRYSFDRSERLLLGGIGQFERRDGSWQPLPSPLPTHAELLWATASLDALRFCAVAADGSGWLVDSQGAHAVELPFPGDHCGFSPGGSFATFAGRPGHNELRVTTLDGMAIADFDLLYLQADIDRYSYGTDRKHLVRLDWNTLQLETLPSPDWCVSQGEDSTVWHDVHLIGSSGTAIVEQHCACTDCHASGVYMLQFAPGSAPQPVVAPTVWQVLQIAVFPEDSALIARSWQAGATQFEGGDRLLHVSRDGSVTEFGPFPDLPTPLHAPVTTPIWRDAR